MSRPRTIGKPTVNGDPLVTVKDFEQSHIALHGTSDTPIRSSVVGGGIGYEHSYGAFAGGGGTIYKGLGAATAGSWVEYRLGALRCDRQWELNVCAKTGPNRGRIRPSINGVDLGAELDCYNAGYVAVYGTWFWNPVPADRWKQQTLRFTVTSKNASATAFGLSIALIAFDRTRGAATVVPAQP